MLVAWLAFPALLAGLSLGVGLLLEAASGRRLPGALLLPVGFAGLIVAGQATASIGWAVGVTVPLAVLLAAVGLIVALRARRELRPSPPLTLAALAVGAVYGAPVIASGEPGFAGYIRLDDTATWLALTDRLMDAGRSLEGLAPSSYEATLAFNLGEGYPIGAFLPLGVGSRLTGTDPAWLIQPYMSVVAAMLALTLAALIPAGARDPAGRRPRSGGGWGRAAVAALAAQPALLVGYVQWGGVKEIAAALLVALAAALAVGLAEEGGGRLRSAALLRSAGPLAVTAAALVALLSFGGVLWLLPALGLALALCAARFGRAEALRRALAVAALAAGLSTPALAAGAVLPPTSSPLTADAARGNLFEPLGLERLAGIWPAGDFRADPVDPALAAALVAVVAVAAGVGLALAWRRRAWPVLVYAGGALIAGAAIVAFGSPWIDGKAMAATTPAVLLLAVLGAVAVLRGAASPPIKPAGATVVRVAGAVALAAILAGVTWSNALAYRDVSLAPYDQLAELERVGEMVAGEGPTLMTEYQPYGVRHFLRHGDPEAVSELRRRRITTRGGHAVPKGMSADTDELRAAALHVYRTLVLRRSPVQSRPPAAYALTWRGRHYEVWQRRPAAPDPGARLGLGDDLDPGATLRCGELAELLARDRGPGLVAAPSPSTVVVPLDSARLPLGWGTGRRTAIAAGSGRLRARATLPRAGTWSVWLGGSVRGRIELRVDGRAVGSARHFLNNQGFFVELGEAKLGPGRHEIVLRYDGSDWYPGSGGAPQPIGPLVLRESEPGEPSVRRVRAEDARTLCGRRWDWVEVA